MAAPLKTFFDRALVERLAASFLAAWPEFPSARFTSEATGGLEEKELLGRGKHIAAALRRALPDDFERAADIVEESLGAPLPALENVGMAPFFYLPHTIWVAEHGLPFFDRAMRLQHALTQRFTAEFSIRPYIEHDPARALSWLERWAEDPSHHVRRLVSEGTRPRLPWAPRLRTFAGDPAPILGLLKRLADDPELYVRRSVANHLNDLYKDQPALTLEVCRRWWAGATEDRRWVVRHALRSAVKKGDLEALAILGFRGGAGVKVTGAVRPKTVKIGGRAAVTLEVENTGRRRQEVVVDLAVHFVKASGEARPKVFKLKALSLAPGEKVSLGKTISFAEHTTRRPHPGRHRLEALVNGRPVELAELRVTR